MKICVTATGQGLDAEVDPRFGRCQYFTIVDSDTMEHESADNASISASGGAGIQAAQFVANKGVEVVLTGNVGPNAFDTLAATGISIVTGAAGKVREAVEDYKSGKLRPSTSGPSVKAHFGMGGGAASPSGQGSRPGMGMGRGMGTGPVQSTKEGEIKALKEESQTLRSRLDNIMERIDKLEGGGNPVTEKRNTGISDVKKVLQKKDDTL